MKRIFIDQDNASIYGLAAQYLLKSTSIILIYQVGSKIEKNNCAVAINTYLIYTYLLHIAL